MFALGRKKIMKEQKDKDIQGGLHMVKFADVTCSNLFNSWKTGRWTALRLSPIIAIPVCET